jgi:hypothetical protein
MTTSMIALCRSYASLVGLPEPPGGFAAEAERRLAWWPLWARLGASLAATAVRWLAPFFLILRPRRFDALSADDQEAVLARLQQTRWPLVRGAFLLIKMIVLGTTFGQRPS